MDLAQGIVPGLCAESGRDAAVGGEISRGRREGSRRLRRGGSAARTVAVEATGPTWAFVDAVQAVGAEVCVVDPRKTRIKAGYAAKTDRLDARRWPMRCGAAVW